jgi:hypothetical protein
MNEPPVPRSFFDPDLKCVCAPSPTREAALAGEKPETFHQTNPRLACVRIAAAELAGRVGAWSQSAVITKMLLARRAL